MTDPAGSDTRSYRLLDHYRLLTCLGVGGMGEVWAARDLAAPGTRIVAVKITKQEGVEAAKVLWDEARIASLIQHPNVCSVHEMGQADGTQYLVMDWCDGASLHDLLQKTPGHALPLPVAVKIAAQVAAGLHAAHELVDETGQALGVVHRDVSPQNVLISSQGAVLVTDFGVAKAAGQSHRPTETGEVKGKLSYMAPEQVKSKDIDRRADVFALGCLLYLATLGKRPFHGDDALATLYQILEKDVERPREVAADYPPSLEAIVMKALAKDRDERFQTAEELQIALERWLVEVHTRITEQDIARVLMEQLGDGIRDRKRLIGERNRHAEQLARGEVAAAPAGDERAQERESSSFTAAVVTPNTSPLPVPRPGDRRRRRAATVWATAGVVAALALGVAILWRLQGVGDAGTSAGQGAERPDAAPVSSSVAVRVSVLPAAAEIVIDGAVVGRGSYEAEVPTGDRVRVLEARLEGHRPVQRSLTFDRSQNVHLELVPVAPASGETEPVATRPANQATPAAVSPPSAVSRPSPAPRPSAAPPRPAPKTPLRPGELPRPQPKKPRPIDTTNPFETPG